MPHFRNFHGTYYDFETEAAADSFVFNTAPDVAGTAEIDFVEVHGGDSSEQQRTDDDMSGLPDTITWTNVSDGLDWQTSQLYDDFFIG